MKSEGIMPYFCRLISLKANLAIAAAISAPIRQALRICTNEPTLCFPYALSSPNSFRDIISERLARPSHI
jgi:hypothetical protein